MITHKGTLPVGVEVDGVVHYDFEVRPQLVSDSIEAMEDPKAANNDSYLGLVLQCKQIVSLGCIPTESISPSLLMKMYQVDMNVMLEAAATLRDRLRTFRDAGKKPA